MNCAETAARRTGLVRGFGILACHIQPHGDEGIETRIDVYDPFDVGIDQRNHADIAAVEQSFLLDRRQETQLGRIPLSRYPDHSGRHRFEDQGHRQDDSGNDLDRVRAFVTRAKSST